MQDKILALPSRRFALMGYSSANTIPVPLTSLIGREQEVAALSDMLKRPDVRLVTLTGPGGVGKTHLGLRVADALFDDFLDGVCFVPLASISDPDLALPTIARELGLKEVQDQSTLDLLKAALRHSHLLLLLDNFEQVAPAAPMLANLLSACPRLTALVTSRAVLHIRGERQFPVNPLALPDLKHAAPGEALIDFPSVALFLERARSVQRNFQVNPTAERTVAEICVRLDGLPLAIELAAARVKLLTPSMLLQRLEQGLPLLSSNAVDTPARHQTLHATIEWSYRLLDAQEQQLFRRLSIFAGGASLQAIEAFCASSSEDASSLPVLDTLASLIDKSLLRRGDDEHEPRFLLLETIREYGQEQLLASGEMEQVRLAHALYYLRYAEDAARELRGPQQAVWLACLEREHDNLRAALRWALEETNDPEAAKKQRLEIALRLCQALTGFWQIHGHYSEGLSILERALAISEGEKMPLRAQALSDAALLVNIQGDTERAGTLAAKSLALYRELEDREGIALALYQLGHVAWLRGDFARASSLLSESLELSRELGDTISVAYAYYSLAGLATIRGEYAGGVMLFEEALALFKREGNKRGVALALLQLADLLFVSQSDATRITPLLEEGLALSQEIGDRDGLALYDFFAGQVALSQGDAPAARALLAESLALYQDMGDRQRIASTLIALAGLETNQDNLVAAESLYRESLGLSRVGHTLNMIAGLEGLASVIAASSLASSIAPEDASRAARLWGAAEAMREAIGAPMPPIERVAYTRSVDTVQATSGSEVFARAWAEGRSMSPEQALAVAGWPQASLLSSPSQLSTPPPTTQPPPAKTPAEQPAGLTAREVEVLRLVAQGLTDAQIAERLVITRRTVNWYLTTIYSKIQVSSRSAATRYALEYHLV
jgi:predicted ATPase/DNA-binding CsgD family transcriptional regulator